jgi:hypothetical protein
VGGRFGGMKSENPVYRPEPATSQQRRLYGQVNFPRFPVAKNQC